MANGKLPTFVHFTNGMSVNINDIVGVMTIDMRKFYAIINSSNCNKERYEIDKDTYLLLKKVKRLKNGKKK